MMAQLESLRLLQQLQCSGILDIILISLSRRDLSKDVIFSILESILTREDECHSDVIRDFLSMSRRITKLNINYYRLFFYFSPFLLASMSQ